MNNYEYKFVEVPTAQAGEDTESPLKVIAQIITVESKAGWRLKQILEPRMSVYGANSYLVILEREARQNHFAN